MNQTKKNGNWKRKNGTTSASCSTGTDIIPVSGYPVSKSSNHEFSVLLRNKTIAKRTLFCGT